MLESDQGDKPGQAAAASPSEALGASPSAAAGAGKDAATSRRQIYTVMALEGIDVADMVNTAMKKNEIGKETPRRIEVVAPNGPSTSGGKKSRQSITLVPVSGQGAGLMCGFLDVAQKVVELRDYSVVAEQFKKRFGARLDVSAEEYVTLMKQLAGVVEALKFSVVAEEISEPKQAALAPSAAHDRGGDGELAASGASGSKLVWLAGGALILIALLVVALR